MHHDQQCLPSFFLALASPHHHYLCHLRRRKAWRRSWHRARLRPPRRDPHIWPLSHSCAMRYCTIEILHHIVPYCTMTHTFESCDMTHIISPAFCAILCYTRVCQCLSCIIPDLLKRQTSFLYFYIYSKSQISITCFGLRPGHMVSDV